MLLSAIAIILAIVFLIVGITTIHKGKAIQTFTFVVSILMAFIPKGLPSMVTLLYVYQSPSTSLKVLRLSFATKCVTA